MSTAGNKFAALSDEADPDPTIVADDASDDAFDIETEIEEGDRLHRFTADGGADLVEQSRARYTGTNFPSKTFGVTVQMSRTGDVQLLRTFNDFVSTTVHIGDDLEAFRTKFAQLINSIDPVSEVNFPTLQRLVATKWREIAGEEKEGLPMTSISVPVVVLKKATFFAVVTDALADLIAAGARTLRQHVQAQRAVGKSMSFKVDTFGPLETPNGVKSTLRNNPTTDVLRCVQLALRGRLKEAVVQNLVDADLRIRGRVLRAQAAALQALADTYHCVGVGFSRSSGEVDLRQAYETGSLVVSRQRQARQARHQQASGDGERPTGEARQQNHRKPDTRGERKKMPVQETAAEEF